MTDMGPKVPVGLGFRILDVPMYVGSYEVGGIRFALRTKPAYLHRLAVRLILGWTWASLEPSGQPEDQ